MERILVTGGAKIGKAGVASIIYQWGQHFDDSRIVYDYLMQSGLPEKVYVDNIFQKGGVIYSFTENKRSVKDIIKWIIKIIEQNKYKIIHINTDSAYVAAAYIYAAKKGGIRKIVVHSHSSYIDDNNVFKRILKLLLHRLCMGYVLKNADLRCACSSEAADWMFGRDSNYEFIANGIEPQKYVFDLNVRKDKRDSLGLSNEVAICNIGRLSYPKNHLFLLDVFFKYHKLNKLSKLYLIGSGEIETEIRNKIKTMGLEDCVVLLGQRYDVPQLLSAMDIMVMPSRFEGLPVTLVEAQMADLPCVVSSAITREASFTSLINYVYSWEIDEWVNNIIQTVNKVNTGKRGTKMHEKIDSDFNITKVAAKLTDILLREMK